MHFLLDHLTASLVAGTVLMIALVVQIRNQDLTAETLVLYSGRKQALETADWMRLDVGNIGWGVTPGNTTLEAPVQAGTRTTRFVFWRRPSASAAVARIVYELRPAATLAVGDTSYATFTLYRCQTAALSTTLCPTDTPPAAQRLTEFRIDLVDNGGMPTAELSAAARLVRFRFTAVAPLAERLRRPPYISLTHYGTTLPLPRRTDPE